MRDLQGKVAVVTGGGSGIGRALALAFADEGMQVVVADIEQDAAEAVAAEPRRRDGRTLAVRTDVAEAAWLAALAARVEAEFGQVNLLCNNAGVFLTGSLAEATPRQWAWLMAVNVFGVIEGVRAFLTLLRRAAAGEATVTPSPS